VNDVRRTWLKEDDMPTLSHAEFAATELMFNEVEDESSGFAPTQILGPAPARPSVPAAKPVAKRVARQVAKRVTPPTPMPDLCEHQAMPASWVTVRWVEEQEALAAAAARRATAGNRVHRVLEPVPARREPSLGWLARLESFLQRVLPANLGSFLGLLVCVSLAIMLMSAVLPMVDRI
jgi:hypothetical protein